MSIYVKINNQNTHYPRPFSHFGTLRMYSYQSRVPPPPPPLSRAVIPSKRPRVSLSGGGSRRTKTSFSSSSKSSQRASRTSRSQRGHDHTYWMLFQCPEYLCSSSHSEGRWSADHQERAYSDQTQGRLSVGEPRAHGEGPQQEVRWALMKWL